jgi:hypothetical protein
MELLETKKSPQAVNVESATTDRVTTRIAADFRNSTILGFRLKGLQLCVTFYPHRGIARYLVAAKRDFRSSLPGVFICL